MMNKNLLAAVVFVFVSAGAGMFNKAFQQHAEVQASCVDQATQVQTPNVSPALIGRRASFRFPASMTDYHSEAAVKRTGSNNLGQPGSVFVRARFTDDTKRARAWLTRLKLEVSTFSSNQLEREFAFAVEGIKDCPLAWWDAQASDWSARKFDDTGRWFFDAVPDPNDPAKTRVYIWGLFQP